MKLKRRMRKVNNQWCGYDLTYPQRRLLTQLTLLEFKKPVRKRRKPFKLVEQVLRQRK